MKQRTLLRVEELEDRNTPSTVINMDVPVSGVFADTCTGENVAYSGIVHIEEHVTIDNNGGLHIKLQEKFEGVTGVGLTSGNNYKFQVVLNEEENLTGGAQELTVVEHINVISQGSPANEQIKVIEHLTFNANGDLTSSKIDFTDVCRGKS